jgi:hypothetical protein
MQNRGNLSSFSLIVDLLCKATWRWWLLHFSKEEWRSVIQFLLSKCAKPSENLKKKTVDNGITIPLGLEFSQNISSAQPLPGTYEQNRYTTFELVETFPIYIRLRQNCTGKLLCIRLNDYMTSWVVGTTASCLWVPCIKSQKVLNHCVVFLIPSEKGRGSTWNWAISSSIHMLSNSLFTNYPYTS